MLYMVVNTHSVASGACRGEDEALPPGAAVKRSNPGLLVSTGLVGRTSTRVGSVVALDDAVTPYTVAGVGTGVPA